MILGAVLILSALLLILYNEKEDSRAGKAVDELLPAVQTAISEQEGYANLFDEEAGLEINGQNCIGYLTIPALNLELPVLSDWSYSRLTIAPCRQFGSVRGDDLVIAGHNYRHHFGRLSSLSAGEPILLTDVNGEVNVYLVGSVDVISPYSAEAVKNSEWDLILYTCNYSGQKRVMVGCERTTAEAYLQNTQN